jgi:hypothetical protein
MDLEDEKTPLEKLGIRIPDELDGLFGDPPLLEAEDPNLYWGLLAGMIRDRNPQSFPEWIYVYDMVHKLWEEQRLKRASTGLMRGEMFNALMYFLTNISADGPLTSIIGEGGAKDLAFKYFSEKSREKREVVALLARYGITPAVLQAKAAQQNSDAIQMFEAMTARRERGRRKLRKEDEGVRRRRESAKDSKKS